ncbi:hypothetical protein KFE94_17110 [bacterium SCSIO 12643]|nr:hypothetical protein KFE94_17110 [bacterium SCSIO 12643]
MENHKPKKIKLHVIDQYMENSDLILYHNLNFVDRVTENLEKICKHESFTEHDCMILETSLLLYTYTFNELKLTKASKNALQIEFRDVLKQVGPSLLEKAGYTDAESKSVLHILSKVFDRDFEDDDRLSITLKDALIMDFIGKHGKERLELHYKESLLKDVPISIKKYYDYVIEYLSQYKPHSEFAQLNIQPKIATLILSLEKAQNKIYRKKEIVLKKELGINDNELKELRKNLKSIKGRDSRGIQTLFRTTSKNHYTLNEMVDRKANIMITVNSIILTVIIGGVIQLPGTDAANFNMSVALLSLASFLSVVFAVIAIAPNKTQGRFTMEEIKNKQGNLLYFGNFHDMTFKDYEWGMLQKLNDSDYLYSSMIKDIYFLGQTLDRKYKLIRISLVTFIVGLTLSFLFFFVNSCMA